MLIHVKSDVQREDEANNNGIEEDDSEEEDETPPRLDVSWLTHPVFSVEQIILRKKLSLIVNSFTSYAYCEWNI